VSTLSRFVAFAAAALLAACTSTDLTPRDPLDAGEWRGTKARMYIDLATQCLRAEDHERARRLLKQAVQFDPRHKPALELLARLAYAADDLDTAHGAATLLLALDPQSTAALCTLGAVAEARNDPATAESFYRRAITDGDALRPGLDLHRLLLAQGRDAEAKALRQRLGTKAEGALEANLDNGAHLAAAGRWDAAATAFDEALAAKPTDAGAATGYALATVMSKDPAKALALAGRLPPHARAANPSLALALAVAHLQAGDCAAALRELDLGASATPARPAMRVLRGEILLQLRHHEAAQAELELAIQGDPASARAHGALGRAHLAQGRPHAAARALAQAVQLAPDDGIGHAMLAAALAGSADLDGAVRHAAIARRDPRTTALLAELERRHPQLAARERSR
jgi:Tfp pilus assembly protein PilF